MSAHSSLRILLSLICILSFSFFSCKKNTNNLVIGGTVKDARSGVKITSARVTVEQQVVSNGTFGGTYFTAASGTTSSDGYFQLEWQRQTIVALRAIASKENYISKTIDLNPDQFAVGIEVTKNFGLYPEAYSSVHIANTGAADINDNISFHFMNGNFDCPCCNNSVKSFSGNAVDTTYVCKLYGDTWLRYNYVINTLVLDTTVVDSVFCPSFATTSIDVSY